MADSRTAKDRIAFLRSLRAVRSFRPDPVPQGVVDDILEVARWSGSTANRQRVGSSETAGTLQRRSSASPSPARSAPPSL